LAQVGHAEDAAHARWSAHARRACMHWHLVGRRRRRRRRRVAIGTVSIGCGAGSRRGQLRLVLHFWLGRGWKCAGNSKRSLDCGMRSQWSSARCWWTSAGNAW
jgi:hypothetical protein